jgi:hypothetical protein
MDRHWQHSQISRFFQDRDKTGLVLDEICTMVGHSVAEQDANGFLGAGGTGKVLRVFEKSVRDGMRAVKIVVGEDKVGSL